MWCACAALCPLCWLAVPCCAALHLWWRVVRCSAPCCAAPSHAGPITLHAGPPPRRRHCDRQCRHALPPRRGRRWAAWVSQRPDAHAACVCMLAGARPCPAQDPPPARLPAGGAWEIAEASIAYGGVAPLTIMAPQVRGRPCSLPSPAPTLRALAALPCMVCLHHSHAPSLPAFPCRPWRRWWGGRSTARRWRLASRLCRQTCRSAPTRQVGRGAPECACLWMLRGPEQSRPERGQVGWPGAPRPPLPLPLLLRSATGGMVEFRRSLAASFLFKGLLFAAQQLEADVPAYASPFPDSYRSGGQGWRALWGTPRACPHGCDPCLPACHRAHACTRPRPLPACLPAAPGPALPAAVKPYERAPVARPAVLFRGAGGGRGGAAVPTHGG